MSAAARARRLDESAEIIVLEKGPYVSFANCGLPYHVSGEITRPSDLLLHTPETLAATLDLDVRVLHEVTAVDAAAKSVTVLTPDGVDTLCYDALVLATGARAFTPDIPGIDHPAVSHLRTVDEAVALAERAGTARTAVVLGAGFIGLEAAEALRGRGLDVTIVEAAPRILPILVPELARLVEAELVTHGVHVRTGVSATGITPAEIGVTVTLSDGPALPADIVVAAIGVRPESTLATAAGLEVDDRGAIIVDGSQRTSDPAIWAVGDATSVRNAVTGQVGPVPLAGPANRQGRRAADAILGRARPARPVLGTAIVRVFSLTAAVTGASPAQLMRAGMAHEVLHLHPGNHAGYFPGAQSIHLVASFSPEGLLLGAQAVGREGVDKRIDVLATALRAGMTADDLAELELAYAPPFGSAKDPVNMLGFMMQNVVDGTLKVWHGEDLPWARENALILDVRSPAEYARGHLAGALNVPHTQVRERLEEIRATAAGRPIRVHCASGFRSYLAHRILDQAGLDSANLSGGMMTLAASEANLQLVSA
jgi:NADPH-dependent 2,4-dienoyl-CoA reductase/sulfur reductase-like enzyme/rhodanese-related sulfurtransferase